MKKQFLTGKIIKPRCTNEMTFQITKATLEKAQPENGKHVLIALHNSWANAMQMHKKAHLTNKCIRYPIEFKQTTATG